MKKCRGVPDDGVTVAFAPALALCSFLATGPSKQAKIEVAGQDRA